MIPPIVTTITKLPTVDEIIAGTWKPSGWEPLEDRVLVWRIEKPVPQSKIVLTDDRTTNGPVLREGIVLAVGPGRWIEGGWWKVSRQKAAAIVKETPSDVLFKDDGDCWAWEYGYREQMDVKPGDKVLFNARWNDLAHAELKGTGSDGSGPLERPLSYRYDPMIHLIQESDIAGKLG